MLEKDNCGLRCDSCHKWMHGICWDVHILTEVCEYLCKSKLSGAPSLRLYCPTCPELVDGVTSSDNRLRDVKTSLSKLQGDLK